MKACNLTENILTTSYILTLDVLHISIPNRFLAMNIFDSVGISQEVK